MPASEAPPGVDGTYGDPRQESIGQLFSELTSDVTTLVRQEIELARVELTAKAKDAGKGAGMLVGAAVVGLAVLGALTTTLIALLALAMPVWVAALIVTILWAVVAAVLAQIGRKRLKDAMPPKPEQTIETVKEDVQWAKTQMPSART